jgi:hypothetical protein
MLPITRNGVGFAGEPPTPEELADLRKQLEKPR